ncbi:pumilio homolog 12-like [Henckelia pumila]|uniref:pumilio homolog 12-like n=1 Tax=Henckelia pumila TaxID=405737 RepID=UPI003C6DF991
MFDKFGSTVILNLFKVCNEQQMDQLVSSVTADLHFLMLLCLNCNGSGAMMSFLSSLRTPKQKSDMICALKRLTPRIVYDDFGFTVVARCFDIFSPEQTQPILDLIADHFLDMATDESGCRLLMKVLGRKAFLLESHPSIISKIAADVSQLSRHRTGSCMVMYVIDVRMDNLVRDIVGQLSGDFALLSMHKH